MARWHAAERLKTHPFQLAAVWEQEPERFLLEAARLAPPIVSVTATLRADTEIQKVSSGGEEKVTVNLKKGSAVHLVLSEANIDRKVFGGEARTAARAEDFDPLGRTRAEFAQVLSWDGFEDKVVHGANPVISMDIAKDVVERFLPSVDTATTEDWVDSVESRELERIAREEDKLLGQQHYFPHSV